MASPHNIVLAYRPNMSTQMSCRRDL